MRAKVLAAYPLEPIVKNRVQIQGDPPHGTPDWKDRGLYGDLSEAKEAAKWDRTTYRVNSRVIEETY